MNKTLTSKAIIDRVDLNYIYGWLNRTGDNNVQFYLDDGKISLIDHELFERKLPQNCIAFKINLADIVVQHLIDRKNQLFMHYDGCLSRVEIWKSVVDQIALNEVDLNSLENTLSCVNPEKLFEIKNGINSFSRNGRPSKIKKSELCIITYANDSSAWFPYWFRYYRSLSSKAAITVITPKPESFSLYSIDNLISVKNFAYDDEARARMVSRISAAFLEYYDWTLVVDVDEFIVPDPRLNLSFGDALEMRWEDQVIYTIGIDIIETRTCKEFDFDKNLLVNRTYGIINSSLGKPSISRVPVEYIPGYHYCNRKPKFSSPTFFNLHLKYASRKVSQDIMKIVSATNYTSDFIKSYAERPAAEFLHPAYNENMKVIGISRFDFSIYEDRFISDTAFSLHESNFAGKLFCLPYIVDFSK
jgi:hypothetical protein